MIRKGIVDELAGNAWAPAATLKGAVETKNVKDALRVAAENAAGVVRVWDEVRVIDRGETNRPAEEDVAGQDDDEPSP